MDGRKEWVCERVRERKKDRQNGRCSPWNPSHFQPVSHCNFITIRHTCANVFWKSNTVNFFHWQGASVGFGADAQSGPVPCAVSTQKNWFWRKKIGCPMAPKTCWSPTFQNNNNNNSKLDSSYYNLTISFPVAQMVEHGASNAKIMGSIPRESKSW